MPIAAGTRLGPYEILGPIGAGGMGEVYRARDTKLGRDVAIKVLPPALSADHEYLARFKREAQVLASLNHPHIAAIYGLEEGAIVMELVDGQTLAERIAGRRAGDRRGTRNREADGGGARCRTREGRHPPRSEAFQREDHVERFRQAAGFRPGEVSPGPCRRTRRSRQRRRSEFRKPA